jgi:hypothetical protein
LLGADPERAVRSLSNRKLSFAVPTDKSCQSLGAESEDFGHERCSKSKTRDQFPGAGAFRHLH